MSLCQRGRGVRYVFHDDVFVGDEIRTEYEVTNAQIKKASAGMGRPSKFLCGWATRDPRVPSEPAKKYRF